MDARLLLGIGVPIIGFETRLQAQNGGESRRLKSVGDILSKVYRAQILVYCLLHRDTEFIVVTVKMACNTQCNAPPAVRLPSWRQCGRTEDSLAGDTLGL